MSSTSANVSRAAPAGPEQSSGFIQHGIGFIKRSLGTLNFVVSKERSSTYEGKGVDEKHYFVIPYRLAEDGYTLYSMRCLPKNAPLVNNLPKKRIFHFPDQRGADDVELILLRRVRDFIHDKTLKDSGTLAGRLNSLADGIDKVDKKIAHGTMLLGGIVAFAHPVAGLIIAAQALLPSPPVIASRFGLKRLSQRLRDRKLQKELTAAEEKVLKEFRGVATDYIENPMLRELDIALKNPGQAHTEVQTFNLDDDKYTTSDKRRMFNLTAKAVTNTYAEALKDGQQWRKACLGPQEIEWLKFLATVANAKG